MSATALLKGVDLLAALVNLALAGLLYSKSRRLHYRAFAAVAFCLSLWLFCHMKVFPDYADPFWMRALFMDLCPLPACVFLFVFGLAADEERAKRGAVALGASGLAFALTVWTPWFTTAAWRIAFTFFLFPVLFVCAARLFWGWHREPDLARRNGLLYLSVGALVAASGGLLEFLPHFGIAIPAFPFGAVSITLYTALVAYSIDRYDLLSAATLARRAAFLLTLSSAAALLAGAVVSAVRLLPGSPTVNSILALYLIVPALLWAWERFGESAKGFFFVQARWRDSLLQAWLAKSQSVLDSADLNELTTSLAREALGVEKASLELLKSGPEVGSLQNSPPPWLGYFRARTRPATRLELDATLDQERPGPRLDEVGAALLYAVDRNAEALVPVMLGGKPAALLWLGPRRQDFYDSATLGWLSSLGACLGLTLQTLQVREELLRADRLSQVGQMAVGIAHEIRNPLAYMKGAAQLARDPKIPAKKAGELLEAVDKECDRLNTLVDDILSYGKPREPVKRRVDVAPLITALVKIMQPNYAGTTRILWSPPPDSIEAAVDPDQLKQIIINLVRNAAIAMSEAKSPEPRVALSAAKQRGKVFIQVADNGPGIPEEIAARLFQPFVTGSKSGTGLGLAMVERLARLNDGHVWVDSKAGVGTLFTVEIMDA